MSDFIFSTVQAPEGKLTKALQSIYHEDPPSVTEYHGPWGSLAVSKNLHQGFAPIETDEYICVVIGGPVLTFTDNTFLTGNNPTAATQQILAKWTLGGDFRWDEDLSGPYIALLVNKKKHTFEAVTDLMSFIPLFEADSADAKIIGTHVDMLSKISNSEVIYDPVSLADFILHGFVTYPYTIYKNIHQLAPASVHTWELHPEPSYQTHHYWIPLEDNPYQSISQAANALREALSEYIRAVTASMENLALFVSGGEDSRTILSFMPKHCSYDGFIFLNSINREGRIAKASAEKYGANLTIAQRTPTHYLDILPQCSDLVGCGSQYIHVHTFGFHKKCKLTQYYAVFGGFLSDTLLKGYYIRKTVLSSVFPFFPQIKKTGYSVITPLNSRIVNGRIIKALNQRRRAHFNFISAYRPESVNEWFYLWPCSTLEIPNLHGNRRLFCSYEPFMANKVIKIAAAVPQTWKLNRRLFQRMAKPQLKPAKHLPHADGWMPYYPWYVNFFIYGASWICRIIQKKFHLIKGFQGPWADWQSIIRSDEWRDLIEVYADYFSENNNPSLYNLFLEDVKQLLENNKLDTIQKINLLQILYSLHTQNKK